VDVSDALFLLWLRAGLSMPRLPSAQAVNNNIQLDVASAYLDLLAVHGLIAINVDTLFRAEQMLKFARDAEQAGVAKTTWDVNRARTEVDLRRQERLDLVGGPRRCPLAWLVFCCSGRPSIYCRLTRPWYP